MSTMTVTIGRFRIFVIATMVALAGCEPAGDVKVVDLDERVDDTQLAQTGSRSYANGAYRFGFDLRASPQEDARQLLPFLKYLEQATGYRFRLVFTPKGKSVASMLGQNVVQFAVTGAVSYIRAKEKYNVVSVARGLNAAGLAKYKSLIVVAPDSPIKDVAGLRDRRFAFGAADSTQGHLLPRVILAKHNLDLQDLAEYSYTGSHRNCAEAVVSREADACGMQDNLAREYAKQGQVRILYESELYPSSGIAANGDVPPKVIAKIKQALLDFDPQGTHKDGLYNWHKTEMPKGFTTSTEADYDELKQWIAKLHFGSWGASYADLPSTP